MTNAAALLDLLIELTLRAQQLAQLLQQSHAENRDVTDAELDQIRVQVATAQQKLADSIAARPDGT